MDNRTDHIKVLIVDDDFSSRRLLARFIRKKWPVKILQAEDGSEAIQLVLKESPNLVILDMLMPFMNGIEVLKILRKDPKTAEIPVIACTAVDDKKEVSEILDHGVTDYLIKPIDQKILLKKIANLIEIPKKQTG